jgi:hypothetical protein
MFFHSVEDGILKWQGSVLEQFDRYILVVVFSWLDGRPTTSHLLDLDSVLWRSEKDHESGFMFYPDQESMIFEYEKGAARSYRADVKGK